MGCDIHAHIEVEVDGQWQHYSAPSLKRRYCLFEKICGVRGDVSKAIAPPRGLPDDCSQITKICANYDGSDGHSHTWLSKDEFLGLIHWMENLPCGEPYLWQYNELGYLNGDSFLCDGKSNAPEFTDCRFICWFDN